MAVAAITQARFAVIVCGLPEAVVITAEEKGPIDWRPLAVVFDNLYMSRGGSLGIRVFLNTPHPKLDRKTPLEIIALGPDQLQRVIWCAHNEVVRSQSRGL